MACFREKWIAVDEAKDQAVQFEKEAEEIADKIEKATAKLAQSYSESTMVLSMINGSSQELSAPEPADILLGLDSMQKAFTTMYQSPGVPEVLLLQQKDAEEAFRQMSGLANKLSSFQQTLMEFIASLSKTASTTDGSLPGGSVVTVVGEANPPVRESSPPAEGGLPVAQTSPLPAAAAGSATRPAGTDTGSTMDVDESGGPKIKRAEDCTHEELMQRRPAAKAQKATDQSIAAGAAEGGGDDEQ